MPSEHLDLSSEPSGDAGSGGRAGESRRFVGVHFVCCDAYARVYINREQSAYDRNGPKCAKRARLRIGAGGTNARFFTAG